MKTTKILKEYSLLGEHHVKTNKGHFTLEYTEVVPTKIGTEPKIKVTFRAKGGEVIAQIKWNSFHYLDKNIIVNTIK